MIFFYFGRKHFNYLKKSIELPLFQVLAIETFFESIERNPSILHSKEAHATSAASGATAPTSAAAAAAASSFHRSSNSSTSSSKKSSRQQRAQNAAAAAKDDVRAWRHERGLLSDMKHDELELFLKNFHALLKLTLSYFHTHQYRLRALLAINSLCFNRYQNKNEKIRPRRSSSSSVVVDRYNFTFNAFFFVVRCQCAVP